MGVAVLGVILAADWRQVAELDSMLSSLDNDLGGAMWSADDEAAVRTHTVAPQ